MGIVSRVDAYRQRHRWAGFPVIGNQIATNIRSFHGSVLWRPKMTSHCPIRKAPGLLEYL